MLNCLITEVRFDDHKTIRRGNHNMRYNTQVFLNIK